MYALARAADAADKPVIPNLKTFMAELAGMDHSAVQYQCGERRARASAREREGPPLELRG